jgi:hypothetical protein
MKARKIFFFEKKTQKAFATWRSRYPEEPQSKQIKVFCCFLSRKKTFLPIHELR